MASKDNKFAKTEGGAMLTPTNSAQPSFDRMNLKRNELPINNRVDNSENEEKNSDNGEEKNPKEQLEKEVAKKGAETALEAAGVPAPVAQKAVEKADESGALDEIVGKLKKKKVKIFASIASSLLPILLWGVMLILVISIFLSIMGKIDETISAVTGFFRDVWTETQKFFSDYYKNQADFLNHLPTTGYVDLAAGDDEGKRQQEINKLSEIVSGIVSPVFYFGSEKEDIIKTNNNGVSISEMSLYYRRSANDICLLAYSGLAKNTDSGKVSYYQEMLGSSETLNADNYKKAIEAAGCTSVPEGRWANFWNSVKEGFQDMTSIDELVNIFANSSADLNKKLAQNINDYEFDYETYKKFLNDYYLKVRFGSELEKMMKTYNTSEESAKDEIISYIELYLDAGFDEYKKTFTEYYENRSGSGAELTIMDSLGSLYGESSCAFLEEYNPLNHEYLVLKGIQSTNIYSVSDGEVIYVNYDGVNLYNNYDFNSKKCLCNGFPCKNYDGSEVKIKFKYEDVEFIATYSNMDKIRVSVGDIVSKGDIIGTEGKTGCTNYSKLTFKLVSENGISYNTNELGQKCSSSSATLNACNFQNLSINLISCNDTIIKKIDFYNYVKEELYKNFKNSINNEEVLKAGAIIIATKILRENDYKVGMSEINIKNCSYEEITISDTESKILDNAINKVINQVLLYNNKFANVKYSNTCNRTEKDRNANLIYNELCIQEAINLKEKKAEEILEIYFPKYFLSENYCLNFASKVNIYSLNNEKSFIGKESYSSEQFEKINANLKSKIEMVDYGSRASVVEAARYLTLALDYRIPYKNGGKFFELGVNPNWYSDGIDSSGFVSWALLNGGAKIEKSMTPKELVNNNTNGNIKITSELYKYYAEIQVGDLAYKDSKVGLIIGKNNGILYVAEADYDKGLIVSKITSYGESESNYSHIYFAADYYNETGKVTSMW